MAKNRKKATEVCVALISELYPGTENGTLTRNFLESLSDKEFDQYIEDVRAGKTIPTVTIPNFDDEKFNEEHFLKFGKKYKIEFFHRLKVTDPDTGRIFTTPLRYMIIRDRVNRLQQMLEDKASFPLDNNHVDELSGQVTNESKGGRLSFPEINSFNGRGFKHFIAESIGIRGGNKKAATMFEDEIRRTGIGHASTALASSDGSKSTHSLAAYLRAMTFSTTLDRRP